MTNYKEEPQNSEFRPVLIRHHYSGVWIGYLLGEGTLKNTITIEGRRVWSWSGDRLETSAIAVSGLSGNDKLGYWERVEIAVGDGDGLIELRTVSKEVVEKAKSFEPIRKGNIITTWKGR